MSSVSTRWGLGERSSEWIKAAREGDRNALERLVEDQRAELLSIAVSQLDSELRVKESPSDIVQDSLLEGFRSFDGFRGRTLRQFAAYLRRILRNNLLDVRRRYLSADKRTLSRENGAADPDQHADKSGLTPSRIVQQRHELETVRQCFECLPERHQQILRLRFWEQLTFEEMAQRLALQPDTARKAFYRAIQAFAALTDGQR